MRDFGALTDNPFEEGRRGLERRATTKTMKTRACVIDFLSCISYTGTSYPDWVSS